jgi:hypothetical protein
VTVAANGGEPPDFKHIPRPYEIPSAEPEKTVGLAEFADFLKG